MSKQESEVLDLEDRDTQNLHQHLEVAWEDIVGEPPTIRSPECAWSLSQHCFRFSRLGGYICLSVLCAPVAACLIGISFACLQFLHIWCSVPCLRMCRISCGATQQFIKAFTHGILIPIMQALGNILSQIRITKEVLPENIQQIDKEKNILIV